ncbi:MAG: ferredoxin:thioredoxin reductase [Spirochaetales bacterium]|nr:ferredoxin:thioredoxin reductase [Spirochaetales bacterium]
MKTKSTDDVRSFTTMVANKQGWVLNPDEEFTDSLVDGLCVNWNRYGYFLCPCRDTEGSKEADESVICPCVYARSDVERYGHCYCALFLRPDFAAAGGQPTGIPDRRGS